MVFHRNTHLTFDRTAGAGESRGKQRRECHIVLSGTLVHRRVRQNRNPQS
jgi:hypothetical protein